MSPKNPAYISWEQYQENLAQLRSNQNRSDEKGHPRQGIGLLCSLLECGHCGARMAVQYHRGQNHHRYICAREMVDYGGKICQNLSGAVLDQYIAEQVLQTLEPATLELSLAAAMQLEKDRLELDKLWQQRLERVQFEDDRAGRHYQLVEPENRLVARQLAQEWESKLQAQQQLQEEYERFCHEQPKQLSSEQQQQIRRLAQDLPALWSAPTTTQAQRKEIIRQVIDKIIVTVEGSTERVQLRIEWSGGFFCQAQIIRPVAKWSQLSYYPQLCACLKQLVEANLTTDEMINCLHQEGFRPPKRRQTFNREIVRTLIRQLGLGTRSLPKARESLSEHEWWLPELASTLEMPNVTLYNWVRRGWVKARQQTTPPRNWIIWADEAELERLQKHRKQPVGEILQQRWKGEVPMISIPPE